MDARSAADFLKSRTGIILTCCLLFGLAMLYAEINFARPDTGPPTAVEIQKQPDLPEKPVVSYVRTTAPLPPSTNRIETVQHVHVKEQTKGAPAQEKGPKPEGLRQFAGAPRKSDPESDKQAQDAAAAAAAAATPPPTSTSEFFAPYGRLIKCQLLNSVATSMIRTPVIGIVTEPVWWNGEEIIPAGSEVHGNASVDRIRDRIGADGTWIVVLSPDLDGRHPNGAELLLRGAALDTDDVVEGYQWGPDDGSYGIKGIVLRDEANYNELKLFAATFLAGFAAGFQDTQTTTDAFGNQRISPVGGSLKNATLAGAGEVLNEYADQLKEQIEKNGFYAFVPGGTPFYLYIQQTIDSEEAGIGASSNESRRPRRNPLIESFDVAGALGGLPGAGGVVGAGGPSQGSPERPIRTRPSIRDQLYDYPAVGSPQFRPPVAYPPRPGTYGRPEPESNR